MPVILSSGRSNTRKAARLAVYEATMIIAKPAHTMPRIRAEKLRGAPERREARSDWHNKGLTWLPKPHPSHMRPMAAADVHHLSALPIDVQGASALPKPRKPQLLPGHDVSHPEWMGNPGQEKQPKKDLFSTTDGEGWQDGLHKCHKCATPSITESPTSLLQGRLRG